MPTFVPHHFLFGPRTHEFPPPPPPKEFDLAQVKPETKAAVAHFVEVGKDGRVSAVRFKRPDGSEHAAVPPGSRCRRRSRLRRCRRSPW